MNVAGLPFTVVGAGRSGLAAANALGELGANVRLVDGAAGKERPANLHEAVAFESGTNLPRPGDVAVLSPGIKEVSPVRAEIAELAAEMIGEVELFFRLCPAPILAITGTDGKSTVTTMLGGIVEASGRPTFVGGNLGNPLCEAIGTLTADSVVVAEISAFQLTTCVDFRPRVAVVTNIAEDHVDYHGSFEAYQAAKRRIWDRMTVDDTLIINAEDAFMETWDLPEKPKQLGFGIASTETRLKDGQLWVNGERLMARSELLLLGQHNVANALAAALAAASFGIPLSTAREALMNYKPLRHRLAPVVRVGDVLWINDSKATNANAASAGLRALDAPAIVLAGGSDKKADFEDFGALVRECSQAAILFGQTKHQLAEAIGSEHSVHTVETIQEAVALAGELTTPSTRYIVLSPACASYDQFNSYGHRGDVFEALVRDLPGAVSV